MAKNGVIGIGCLIFVIAVVVMIIVLVATSLERLEYDEIGLKYNTISKHLYEDPLREGLHTGPPGFEFIKFSAIYKSYFIDDLKCLNKDEVEISLDLSFQYKLRASQLYQVALKFKDQKTHKRVLNLVAIASIHEACSKFNTSQFQSERQKFQDSILKILTSRMREIYTDLTELQLQDIKRPRLYENVIQAMEVAREDIKLAEEERPKYITIAKNKLLQIENEAKIVIQKAESDYNIAISEANSTAQSITIRYSTEAESYKEMKEALGLNAGQFIRYMATRAIFENKGNSQIDLAMPQPAQFEFDKKKTP